jgi:Cu/Ag efflux pump CusA
MSSGIGRVQKPLALVVVGRTMLAPRSYGSTVLDPQRRVSEEVKLLPGYNSEWVGEFGSLQDATHGWRLWFLSAWR